MAYSCEIRNNGPNSATRESGSRNNIRHFYTEGSTE